MNGYYTRRRRCRFCPEHHERFHVCPVETAYRRGCVQATGLVMELVFKHAWDKVKIERFLNVLRRLRAESPFKEHSWLLDEAVRIAAGPPKKGDSAA